MKGDKLTDISSNILLSSTVILLSRTVLVQNGMDDLACKILNTSNTVKFYGKKRVNLSCLVVVLKFSIEKPRRSCGWLRRWQT